VIGRKGDNEEQTRGWGDAVRGRSGDGEKGILVISEKWKRVGEGRMKTKLIWAVLCLALIITSVPAWAQTTGEKGNAESDTAELAKAAQNPIADMVSIPLQSNLNLKYGQNRDKSQIVNNFQPVIPFSLNKEWNLITRTIVPVIYTEFPAYQTGLGNIQFSGFFSPAKASKFIWGVGPVLQFPTHTDTFLGSDKWSGGPSAVGLTMQGPWVVGILAQNIWSYAGPPTTRENPTVNQFLVQPFVNYNLPKGWYLTGSPIITADWKAAAYNQWTVPVGGGIGKIFKIGKLPFNANLAAYYSVVRPETGPDWTIRGQLTLLLPKSMS
jgi:hypothetical protein